MKSGVLESQTPPPRGSPRALALMNKMGTQRSELILTVIGQIYWVKVTNSKTFQTQIFSRIQIPAKNLSISRNTLYDYREIAELRKTQVVKKLKRAILRKMIFANDCAKLEQN